MSDIDEMINNVLLEDRVLELEHENAGLKAQVTKLEEANLKLSTDCDIYREGLAQICNEMTSEFGAIESAIEDLKMRLWHKTRRVILRATKGQ